MTTSDVLFSYKLFKTIGSFNWTNDVEVESANLDTFLRKKFIEITFDVEVKSMYTFRGIGYYEMNEKTVAKYQTVEPIFQVHSWWNLGLAMCINYHANGEAL